MFTALFLTILTDVVCVIVEVVLRAVLDEIFD
jgi:hypothetical protein